VFTDRERERNDGAVRLDAVHGALWVDTAHGAAGLGPRTLALSRPAVLVLAALAERPGRVVTRDELVRRADLENLSSRRCDQLLVDLRRALGPTAVRNVRGRGWMLELGDQGPVSPL
jgi:two-component system, OmpR family, response regulator